MAEQLSPKGLTLTTQDGVEKAYFLSKFPAVAGREIVAKYPLSNMPKLGDYAVSEETMLKLMAFVAVETAPGSKLMLTTRALVDNHVPDWEVLARLEWAMLEYNCSFFSNGLNSDFLKNLRVTAPQWISQMLTALSAQSSAPAKPPSEN
jgi:hypothetical protein